MSILIGNSCYSLHSGTLKVERLVNLAKVNGYKRVLLCDLHNSYGAMDFVLACQQHGIKPALGMTFTTSIGQWLYTAVALSNIGWQKINEFFSYHQMEKIPWPALPNFQEDIVWVLPIDSPIRCQKRDDIYFGLLPWQVNKRYARLNHEQDRIIAWNFAAFQDKEEFILHKVLRAIHLNILFSQLQYYHHIHESALVRPNHVVNYLYQNKQSILKRTEELLDTIQWENNWLTEPKNRDSFTGSYNDDRELLRKLTMEGFVRRYPLGGNELKLRLEKELGVIDKLGYNTYFLITEDIVSYARRCGFYHVGRGSGANSMTSYCLGITDVDPVSLDLYFERFINEFRSSPPDFDIDFSWDERDQVMDYIYKRYGRNNVALLATYTTFQLKSIFRSVGQVVGLNKDEISRLQARASGQNSSSDDIVYNKILKLAVRMQELPDNLSIHPGGMLITEKPIHRYSSQQITPKGFPVTHIDMYVAETHGFHKYDILSQRGIGHIKEAVKWVKKNQGIKVDIHQVDRFVDDQLINENLKKGETLGCFYIESPAMRSLLKKLRCNNYKGLVAASSIIRPGVSKSGMMQTYIERKHNPEKIKYLHPVMGDLLQDTFGIMVYQEDVLKVAHHFAGLSLAEADILRRGMSGKSRKKDKMRDIKTRFFSNCMAKGFPDYIVQEVWRQIESFSGYSFCKAHSASFAVESYQSLFLRTYYPLEFMVGVINNFGGFYRSEIYFHESRRLGAKLELPCVNKSDWLSSLEDDKIYIGFAWIKNLEQKVVKLIINERYTKGNFKSFQDFLRRINISREQLNLLIRIGAFRFCQPNSRKLLWEKNEYLGAKPMVQQQDLFENRLKTSSGKFEIGQSELEQAFEELDLLGFTLKSPFFLIENEHNEGIEARKISQAKGRKVEIQGYLISTKHVRTSSKQAMAFANWYDRNGDYFDSVHFPKSWSHYPVRGPGCYRLIGKIKEEYGHYFVDVMYMQRIKTKSDPRFIP